jgi:hypothetical protein
MPISPFELQELPLSAKEIPHQAELGTQQGSLPAHLLFPEAGIYSKSN